MFGERRFIFRRGRKKSHWVRVAAAAGVFFASIAVASCGGSSVFPSGVSGGDGGSNGGSGNGSGGNGGSGGGIPPAFSPCASPLYEGCEKGSGTAEDPYRIYNIYHLQAMGGGLPNGVFPALALLFPATEESLRAGVATLFGEAEARTAAHYRLENDIDATQTGQTNWHEGEGFLPIGDSASPFLGALDGAGYAIRGLQMRRAGEMAGFFGVVGASGRISNLGVDGGEVEGDSMVGLLAARVEAGGVIEGAWGRGRVRGSNNVGGLAGYLADGATMRRSWFGGYVRGVRNVGGLVGEAEARSASADTIADSWAMAQTRGFVGVGGLAGNWESGNRMTASWAGGPLTGTSARDRFGCLASGSGESSASYSSVETSGCSAAGVGGTAVDSLQTLVAPEWNGAVWDFGGDSDFPALRNIATSDGRGRSLQAGGMIFGLTRLLRGDGTVFPTLPLDLTTSVPGEERSMLRLDVNGLAADDGSATARLSSCRISGGAISAESNYNGARVSMLLLSSFGARLSLEDEDLCVVGIDSGAGGLATLRLSYAGAGSESADVLHFDYAAQLSPGLTPPSPPPPPIPPPSPLSFGFAETPTGFYPVMVFSGATVGEIVLTVTVLNGSLVSFAGGGFASGGGSEAALSLTESAVDLFTIDGLELSLTLEARSGEGQSATVTTRFVSSALPFNGSVLSVTLSLSEAQAGAEIFAAEEVGLTIWHNEDEDERYTLSQTGNDFGVDVATGLVTVSSDVSSGTYNFTLQLTDGETTAERPLRLEVLSPALAIVSSAALSSGRVTVLSDAGSGHAALTVTLRGGTNAAFASSSASGLTATGGGDEAEVSLTASAIELFTLDGLELSLALTASDADESSTVTVRFASSARGFDGAALRELIRTTRLGSGTEVFAAADANLTIWHNNDGDEEYSLEGVGSELFAAGSDGAVRAAGELEVGSGKSYALTLILRDGEASARRRLELELSPPALSALDGVTATVEWDAGSGTAALSLTLELETGATFAATTANGLETAGGREATILLANDAVNLFTADGLELTLTLAASNGGETVFLTATFESSSRPFAGGLAESMLPLSEAIAGVEIFTAEEVGLTIWHNDNEDERYELTQEVELFGVDEGTGRVTASLEVSAGVYEMTLGLTDGETTAERPLRLEVLPPALAIVSSSALSSGRVTVLSDAGSGYAALTVTLRGGTNATFASSSASGLTATGGGDEAEVSLTASAIELFTEDGLELSLALTASDADESSTVTVRFASSARGFDGAALSELIRTTALQSGTEVFAAADAKLTIWHNNDGDEEYSLEGDGSDLFTAGSDGAVRSAGELEVGSGKSYALTLILRDGEASARRRLELELSPPALSALDGVTATVEWDAGSGTAALSLTLELETGATFAATTANGLETAGGREATILLANDAVNLFTADGLELTLTLAASNGGETVFLTATFESSSRPFAGGLAESMLPLSEAIAGVEIFTAEEVGLTIWHNDNEDERYELTQEVELFGVDEGTGRVTASLEVSAGVYEMTLGLTDGETTAERPLRLEVLPPALAIVSSSALSSGRVTVLSDAGSGYAALTVTLRGGTNAAFLSSSASGLTATGGEDEAEVSLTASAIELFTVDGLELSLALTASDADELSTVTVRFVSAARGFDGAALRELIQTTALGSGTEVFAAADANLTIWHNDNGDEEYILEGDGSDLFTAGSDGAVRSAGELEVGSGKSYALTLILRDGEASARRRLELELSPPVLSALDGVTAAVEWDAGSGTAALSLTLELETGATFAATIANGLETAGGREATILLANDAVNLFTADGLELTLTLAASNGGGTVFLTAAFESSSRPFAGGLAESMLPLSEAIAGVEIFTAEEVGLTIWHNEDEDERYELTQDVELFGVDKRTGRVTVSLDASSGTYNFTLQLTDGEATAERPLRLEVLPPALAIVSSAALSSGRVTVSSDAGSGYAALTVTLRGGTNAAFLSSSAPGLTATGGGVGAVVSLTASAIELFTEDGLELSLALTASDADESSTVTVRFASSARGFDGAALSELIRTTALGSGTEVFAAADANLTIWHNNNDDEEYSLEGVGSELFTAGSDGAVRAAGELEVGSGKSYALTLILRDGEASARRRLELQLSPPVLSALDGVTATVAWDAGSGTAALSLTLELETGATFAATIANGLETAGGREATILLANDAVNLFTADGLELTLTLAASNGGGTVFLTARFESSSRPFAGGLAESMLPLSEAIAGAEIFTAEEVGLTIWHNEDEDERYELTQEVELFGVDEGTGRVTASLEVSAGVYEMTLGLTDGETTAERPLRLEVLPPALAIVSSSALSSDPVTVSSDAGSGHGALTVTLRGGTNAAFASSSASGLTATGGGVEAVVSLTASAIELFTVDGLELSLALTASDADESSTVTVRFASSARGFDGAALSELIRTTALQSGTEVFAASDANLTIWHNENSDEEYTLEGDGSELFTAGSDGAVSSSSELEVGSGKSYALTLILRDGEASARRRLELQLSPPVLSALDGVTATVEWDAGSGTAALSLTLELETGATFAATIANGLETAGGREATILLANDAVNLFTADGLELTLTLAASNGGGTVFLTATFESSSRPFAGEMAEAMLPLSEAIAGAEIFTAEEVGLTIWHNDDEDERYELTQDVELFGVDEGTGRVTASLEVSAGTYNFTLQLTDGETTAERPLRLEVLPPALAIVSSSALSSGRVTVSSDAGSGYAALTVTLRGGTNAAFASSSAPRIDGDGRRSRGGGVVDGERD